MTLPDSSELVDFAIALLNSVLNLPNRQVKFFGTVINPAHQFFFQASLNSLRKHPFLLALR